jgi:Family of unknown function (DUF5994)
MDYCLARQPRAPNEPGIDGNPTGKKPSLPGCPVIAARSPRIVIAQRPTLRDHLHGAWWPYTTDIEHELAPMLAAVVPRFRAVVGVMLNRDEWPTAALNWLPAHAGRLKISWYGLPESHLVVLHCSEQRRISLLLLPPDTPEEIAVTATLMASTPGNGLTTNETLSIAREQANPTTAR